jgi:hypothetical protein
MGRGEHVAGGGGETPVGPYSPTNEEPLLGYTFMGWPIYEDLELAQETTLGTDPLEEVTIAVPAPATNSATTAEVEDPPDIHEEFRRGYRDASGPEALLEHFIANVIPCESDWNLQPKGQHVSAAQFSADSWVKARRSPDSDPTNPYEVGFAVGRWLNLISEPGSSAGWPTCFWRGR